MYIVYSTLYIVYSTVYIVYRTVYIVYSTVYIVYTTVNIDYSTVYIVNRIQYSVYCIQYSKVYMVICGWTSGANWSTAQLWPAIGQNLGLVTLNTHNLEFHNAHSTPHSVHTLFIEHKQSTNTAHKNKPHCLPCF